MEQIELSPTTKILPILDNYPDIYPDLLLLSKKIARFQNPIMKRTIGKRANLKDVANFLGIDLDKLINTIKESVQKHYKITLPLVKESESGKNSITEFEHRKEILKSLVLALHEGGDRKKLQENFKKELGDVDATEIAVMEQELIDSGELTAEQITQLCDIHVAIFEDALGQHAPPDQIPGHPLHTYREENKKAKELISKYREIKDEKIIDELEKIVIHYTRLQNQLFPLLEEAGFTGPTQVMWAKHDEVRDMFKKRKEISGEEIVKAVEDMIFKEESILFPTAAELLTDIQWKKVKDGEEEIGFAWVKPGNEWEPITPETIHKNGAYGLSSPELSAKIDEALKATNAETKTESAGNIPNDENAYLKMNTGKLTLKQINAMLTHLPLDLSFINENDEVMYYSDTPDRIFPRSPGVIGRKVQNCHPPKSQHIVNRILSEFKAGTKDEANFWIHLGDMFVYIRYFAVRDKEGKYLGTLEVSQEISGIQALKGDQRLLDWDEKNPEK